MISHATQATRGAASVTSTTMTALTDVGLSVAGIRLGKPPFPYAMRILTGIHSNLSGH